MIFEVATIASHIFRQRMSRGDIYLRMTKRLTFEDIVRALLTEFDLGQSDIASATGASQGSVSKWGSGKGEPSGQNATALVELLQTQYRAAGREEIVRPVSGGAVVEGGLPASEYVPPRPPARPTVSEPEPMARLSRTRVPVYGQAVGGPSGEGRFVLNGVTLDWIPAPPGFDSIRNPYAVRVYGSSMEPRLRPRRDPLCRSQRPCSGR